jgi:MFS transporter, ACS family, hexuronate transporter
MVKANRVQYRWVVGFLIFLITLVNFIDRSAISFVSASLKKEFHFTDTEMGTIFSAFGLGYVILTALGGWLVDRFGTRIVWALAAVMWSIFVGFMGFAGGFVSFVALRFLLGVAEGPHFPAISKTVGDWLLPLERARALSLGLIAIPLSSMVGSPIISYLVVDFGWRSMFFIVSAFGIVWGIVWYFLFRDRPEDSRFVSIQECNLIASSRIKKEIDTGIDWHFILTHPALIANNVAYFAFGYMLFFATLWLPDYFLSQHSLNLKSVGWYLTIPWFVAAAFLQVGGMLSDWLYKKTKSSRIARSHVIWVSQLLAAVCFVLLSYTNTLGASIVFLSLGLGFGFMPQPAFFSINIDVAKERAGSSQGITSGCLALAGIVAPLLTGRLVDLTGGNYRWAFLLLAIFSAIAVIAVILFHHPDKEYISTKRRVKAL